jgi:uncharacterized protein (DUF697 family)
MSTNLQAGADIINKYSLIAGGTGFVPVPLVDVAAVTTTQLLMVKKLAHLYGHTFSENWGKSTIGALVGGLVSTQLAYGTGGALLRSVPVAGWTLGALAMPAFATATTYALGKVFLAHFEAGGTVLNFDVGGASAQMKSGATA